MTYTILYVEDNAQNMRLVRKILVHAGYVVLEATDGASGVETALRERPDLILMDINLPDIDGSEAARSIKAGLPQVPIIALTANAMYGDEERILSAGCDGYISKPISRESLLALVTRFLIAIP